MRYNINTVTVINYRLQLHLCEQRRARAPGPETFDRVIIINSLRALFTRFDQRRFNYTNTHRFKSPDTRFLVKTVVTSAVVKYKQN